jgi:hypothetical protein
LAGLALSTRKRETFPEFRRFAAARSMFFPFRPENGHPVAPVSA